MDGEMGRRNYIQVRLGFDGKSPYERLRGERCKVPMAMFGETVLFLPLKTAKSLREDAQPKMDMGIWL